MTDAELERHIEKRYQWLMRANTPEQRRLRSGGREGILIAFAPGFDFTLHSLI